MKTIKKICITGGTCGGKTTTFNALKKKLIYDNLQIFWIPESATEMMDRNIFPIDNNVGLDEFQILNLRNQLFRENLCFEAAKSCDKDNVLIICDRSSFEQQVFLDDMNDFYKTCDKCGTSPEELKNSYDAVFHLVSTAIGAEFAFGMLNNEHRIHNLEESRKQELRAQEIWKDYPNFFVFDNSVPFDKKIDNVISSVKKYIDENFPNL